MQLDILIVFLFSAFALTLSPGPDIIYVFIEVSVMENYLVLELSLG